MTAAVATPEPTAQPRLASVKGVEIFAAGTHRGKAYTVQDLDEMVRNFEPVRALVKPTVVTGHEEDQSFLENSGYPAAGTVSRIWRDGDTLLADFTEVPLTIARLIDGRAYRSCSSEVYDDFVDESTGQHYGKVLRRVALLGGELPQIKTLADLPLADYGADGAAEFCSAGQRKSLLRYQEIRPAKSGNTFHVFCEVRPMAKKRQKVAKFSEQCKATWKKFADEPALPDAAAPAPAGVTRDDMIAMLTEAGYDPAVLEKAPDDLLAEMIRVSKSGMAQMADATAQPGTVNAEPPVTPPVQTPAPAPAPAHAGSGIPGVPSATPSQVTLKFGEKDVDLNQVLKPLIDQAVAAAVKPINDGLAATQGNVSKFQEDTKKASIDAKLDLLVKQGKVLPAELDDTKEDNLRKQLQRANGVHKFADGLTELDKQLALLEARPQLVKFSEQVKAGKSGGGKPGTDDDPEVQEVQKFAEDHAASFSKGGLKTADFVGTFKKLRADRPDYTAAQYTGSGR